MRRLFALLLLLLGTSVLADENAWIQEAYHKAAIHEQIENYSNAIKSILPVLRAYPSGYTVNLRLGWFYYLMGHYANSIAHYNVAIKMAPSAIEPKIGLLLPQLAQERYSEVEQTAYKILKSDFYSYYGNLRLSVALRKLKKTELALKVVNKMLILYPTDVTFLVEMGLLYQQSGEKEKAKAVFKNVIILDAENVTAKTYLDK
ncbi:MAG: hypothetical protein DRR19_17405 [Candidatus Parabeggiatoa sp. nov. 1]|nr:MAG: hypothetical protein DRR19_17405 [Gammaproteobacteria bacterium]HEC85572.1 hypothetical protein [Thioploca sp.]